MTEFEYNDLAPLFEHQDEGSEVAEVKYLAQCAEYIIRQLFQDEAPLSGFYGELRRGQRHPDHEFSGPEDYEELARFYQRHFKPHFLHDITSLEIDLGLFYALEDETHDFVKGPRGNGTRYVAIDRDEEKNINLEVIQEEAVTRFTVQRWNTETGITELVEASFRKYSPDEFKVDVSFTATLSKDPAMIRVSWNGIAKAE